jgi:hypothetical protein
MHQLLALFEVQFEEKNGSDRQFSCCPLEDILSIPHQHGIPKPWRLLLLGSISVYSRNKNTAAQSGVMTSITAIGREFARTFGISC